MVLRKPSLKILGNFLFIIVLLTQLHSLAQDENENSPSLVIDETNVYLGQLKPGEKAEGVFIVKNEGTDTLFIKRVAPT